MSNLGVNFNKLTTAVDWSIRELGTPRKKRHEAIRQYVGAHYADGGAEKVVPTNFLELAVTIYTQQLAGAAPRAMVSTPIRSLKPQALDMQYALNQLPGEIGLADTLRRTVIDALFSYAVTKTGIASSGVSVLGHDYGEPFVDLVSPDRHFLDMSAPSMGTIQFQGDDYWLPLEDVREMWEGKASQISPDNYTMVGADGNEKAQSVSSSEGAALYRDKVWIRDIWLPRENKLVTYAVKSSKILSIVEWDGPEEGPYAILGFSDVPDNLLPLPPVALWRDLHDLGNRLFRKLAKQADNKKTVAAFGGGNDEDAQRFTNAADGESIKYTGQKPEAVTAGGIDAPTLAFYLQSRDLFSYFAGNLDSMGGLAPMTDTIGQDKLLSEAASARLDFMRTRTLDFTKKIFKSLAWYEWTDPVRERMIEKKVPGTDIVLRKKWSKETRDGDWLDFNFDIDVYSMQSDSPSIKLQRLGHVMERYILPLMPVIQQQGGEIDAQGIVSMVGELSNMPEVSDFVKFPEKDPMTAFTRQPQGNPNPMPANTTRTYERVNRPGATRHGKDDVMSRVLMGAGAQKDEMNSLTRRAG